MLQFLFSSVNRCKRASSGRKLEVTGLPGIQRSNRSGVEVVSQLISVALLVVLKSRRDVMLALVVLEVCGRIVE